MASGQNNLNHRIRQTLYMLKRQYGGIISIYQMGDMTVNHLTGVKTVPKTVTTVKRAIILPVKVAREAIKNAAIISANRAFVGGGYFDAGTRMFIIEQKDAPGLELGESDWIVYNNGRYEIKSFEEYEFGSAWVVIAKRLEGEVPSRIYTLAADNLIRLTHEVS